MSRVEKQYREKLLAVCKTYDVQVDPTTGRFNADVGMIYDMISMADQLEDGQNKNNEVVKIETIKEKDL